MICPQCSHERLNEDFFGKPICYRCVYASKVDMRRKCRECGNLLPTNKWKYCGDFCGKKAAKKMKKEYWTNYVT